MKSQFTRSSIRDMRANHLAVGLSWAISLGTLAAAVPANASSLASLIAVTNCDDNGPGSLRQVYSQAVDNETIDLTQLTCSRITLTTGALVDSAAAANVTLQGPGRELLAIDGDAQDRVFIHRGIGDLHLQGLTVANGRYARAAGSGGGCIFS